MEIKRGQLLQVQEAKTGQMKLKIKPRSGQQAIQSSLGGFLTFLRDPHFFQAFCKIPF